MLAPTPSGSVRLATALVALAAVALSSGAANAGPGLLDPSFGIEGEVTTSFAPHEARISALALQPDGKLVLAGGAASLYYDNFTLARYDAGGLLDGGFGTGGLVTTPSGGEDASAVAVQPDGKIVAAGVFGQNGLGVVRYDGSGALDPSFGSGGIVATGFFSTSYTRPQDMVIQPDGKIVVATGAVLYPGSDRYGGLVARFLADGTLDATFGVGGAVVTDRTVILAMARGADGTIVVAGPQPINGDTAITLERFTADGSRDAAFGTNGLVTSQLAADCEADAVAVQPDGKIVVGGRACQSLSRHCRAFLARYLGDGAPDASFGDAGVVLPSIGVDAELGSRVRAIALDAAGRIVFAGAATSGRGQVFMVARYLSDGRPDATFAGGSTTNPIGQEAMAVAIAPDGAIVAAGPACFLAADSTIDCAFAAVRYRDCSCAACEQCDGLGGCVALPRTRCRHSLAPRRSQLLLHDGPGQRRFAWHWTEGERTSVRRLGIPTTSDDYALCVYDASAPTPKIVLRATAAAGADCGNRSCWKAGGIDRKFGIFETMQRFVYRDPKGSADGLTGIELRSGDDGQARMAAKGRGPHVALAPLPVTLPLRVQLQSENGECWESTFDEAGVRRNDAGELRAQGTVP